MSAPRQIEADQQTLVGHFERPSPAANRWIEMMLRRFPLRPLDAELLCRLQNDTARTFLALGADPAALNKVVTDSPWEISAERAPADAWGGEVLRRVDAAPLVVLYRDSPLTRLPGRHLFELAFQLAVDHMYGHLYEFYLGSQDWGEEVACRWQYRLLRRRGGPINRMTAYVVALTHRWHKQIPLDNYG